MKLKIPYSIRKSLIKILPFMATAIMAASCQKEPYKDITIDWDWTNLPEPTTIQQYATERSTRTITLNLLPSTTGLALCPRSFNRGFNFLEQECFSIAPDKIVGSGTVFVDEQGGAHILDPQETDIAGMSLFDSIRCTRMGFSVARGRPPANSK